MPCDAPCEDADVGDEYPCLCAGDGFLPILGEPSASPEPGKGAFDHPASRQQFEALGDVGAFDDLQFPVADPGQCVAQFGAGIAAIGEHVAQPGKAGADGLKHSGGTVPILHRGAVHNQPHHEAERVGDDMALAALDLLAGIIGSVRISVCGWA
jgi:hypothetical protein